MIRNQLTPVQTGFFLRRVAVPIQKISHIPAALVSETTMDQPGDEDIKTELDGTLRPDSVNEKIQRRSWRHRWLGQLPKGV
jgi:hypothetical protein